MADLERPELGLIEKYRVQRIDGNEEREGAAYFVLNYAHDQYARIALRAYIAACEFTHPKLAEDLTVELSRVQNIQTHRG